jgi:flagellar assembly factor FliW
MTSTLVDLPTLDLGGSLIGFPQARRFALVRVTPDNEMLFRLVALDVEGLEFVAAAPYPFFPGYAPEIDDAAAERLELIDADGAMLLVLLTVGPDLASTTANLFAPIVVNVKTRRAVQVTLPSGDYSLKAPLTRPAAAPSAAPSANSSAALSLAKRAG